MNSVHSTLGVALAGALFAPSSLAQDAEQATHTDEASSPQVSFEAKGTGWTLRQYQLGCLSHLSYLLVVGDEAAVIDPQRDVDHYLRDAQSLGGHITHVLLTHPHADFVAGHTELAHRTGAEIDISKLAGAQFPHRDLADGDQLQIGKATLTAWLTPGHTPNAMTFLLDLPGETTKPAYALTGDTLFVGSIGRPDLLDVPPAELAAQSFDSLQRLETLPDATIVLPAHGAGSLCGAHLSPETSTTIGREKASNPYLQIHSKASFIAKVISHQPVAPQYFAFNVALNVKGPPLIEREDTMPALLEGAAALSAVSNGAWVVDLRDQVTYAKDHIEGSINVALRGRLDTWAGIVVPFEAPLLLVGSDAEVREGTFRLRRIGLDHVTGRLPNDPEAWRKDGLTVRQSKLIEPKALAALMAKGSEPMIVDVRTADEFADLRIGEVGNIPVTESARFAQALDKSAPILMVCNSAYRSSMAVGLAERSGFRDVASLDGGMDAWIDAGLPVIGSMAPKASAAPLAETRTAASTTPATDMLSLPEPIDAAMLARVLLEQPESYAVIDIRPAWQFAEWSVPGAKNVATNDLAAHLSGLAANLRVVLVDRDGSLAFAVAGALMAHDPDRVLRVLHGGLQQYHREIVLHAGAEASPAAAAPAATTQPAPTTSTPSPTKKKRSAGC